MEKLKGEEYKNVKTNKTYSNNFPYDVIFVYTEKQASDLRALITDIKKDGEMNLIDNLKKFVSKKTKAFSEKSDSAPAPLTDEGRFSVQTNDLLRLGEKLFHEKKFEEAKKTYQKILEFTGNDVLTQATILHNVASICLKTNQTNEAQEYLTKSEQRLRNDDHSQSAKYRIVLGFVTFSQAFCLFRLGANLSVVSQKYEEALAILNKISVDEVNVQLQIVNVLLSLVQVKRQEGKYEDAKKILEEARIKLDSLDSESNESEFLNSYVAIRRLLASVQHTEKNDFLEEKYLLEADDALQKSSFKKDVQQKLEISVELGDLYYRAKRYQEARRRYEQALEYDKSLSDSVDLNVELSYKQLLCYAALEDDLEVIEKSQKILQKILREKTYDSSATSPIFGDINLLLALAYKNRGESNKSQSACQEALKSYLKNNVFDPEILSRYQCAFELKFELESQRVDFTQRDALRRTLENALTNPANDSNLINALENYATYLRRRQDNDDVQDACIKTLGMLSAVGRSQFVPRVYKILARVCFQDDHILDAQRYCRQAQDAFASQGIEDKELEETALQINERLIANLTSEEAYVKYSQLVDKYVKNKQIEFARRYCVLAIKSYEQTSEEFQKQNSEKIALFYLSVGDFQRQNNLLLEAQDSLNKFLERYEALIPSPKLNAKWSKAIASAYFFLANRMPTKENQQRASTFFDSLDSETKKIFYGEAATISRLLADRLLESQNHDEALAFYNRAYELYSCLYKTTPGRVQFKEVASLLNSIGSLYFQQRDYNNAKIRYKQAWNASKGLFGTQSIDLLFAPLHNLITIYKNENKFEKIQRYYKEALEILENATDVDERELLKQKAIILHRLSLIAFQTGRLSEVEEITQQAKKQINDLEKKGCPIIDGSLSILLESSRLLEKKLDDSLKLSAKEDLTSYLHEPDDKYLFSFNVSFLRTEQFVDRTPEAKEIRKFEKKYRRWLVRQSKRMQKKHPVSRLTILTSLTNDLERSILSVSAQIAQKNSNVAVVVMLPTPITTFQQTHNYPNLKRDLSQATKSYVLPLTRQRRSLQSSANAKQEAVDNLNIQTQSQIGTQYDYLKYCLAQQSFMFLLWDGKKIKQASEKIKNKYFESIFHNLNPKPSVNPDTDE